MSALVSSFVPVEVGKRKVLFFFVCWIDFVNDIAAELEKHREAFGQALGLHATVLQAYKGANMDVAKEVMAKAWPPDIGRRIEGEQYPFMLAIENNFSDFEPGIHRWAIVWFSEMADNPSVLWKIFASIARKVQQGEDIFEYLERLSRSGKYDAIAKHIEIKPGTHGVSIDIKAIFEDLLGLGLKHAT
jgi:hypothetical protein